MGTIGQAIFASVSSGLANVLGRTRTQAASALDALAPKAGFTGTVLDGALLVEIKPTDIVPSDPGVTNLLNGLEAMLPPAGEGSACSLHGFDPGGGQPRGLAIAMTIAAPVVTFVAALTADGPAGLAFQLAAVGAGSFGPTTLPLINGWSVVISGNVGGGGRLLFPFQAPPQVLYGLSHQHLDLAAARLVRLAHRAWLSPPPVQSSWPINRCPPISSPIPISNWNGRMRPPAERRQPAGRDASPTLSQPVTMPTPRFR